MGLFLDSLEASLSHDCACGEPLRRFTAMVKASGSTDGTDYWTCPECAKYWELRVWNGYRSQATPLGKSNRAWKRAEAARMRAALEEHRG